MDLLVRRAFSVSFEWRRLAHIVALTAGFALLGDLLLPTQGPAGLLSRAIVFFAIPPALLMSGFASREEISRARSLLHRARSYGSSA
jgi:hypothetical protein